MSQVNEIVFGLPTLPRSKQPSMYDILSWGAASNLHKVQPQDQEHSQEEIELEHILDEKADRKQEQFNNKVKKNNIQSRGQTNQDAKTKRYDAKIKYQLYIQEPVCLRKTKSHVHYKDIEPKIHQEERVKEKVNEDEGKVSEIKKRIKKFELVTRDLPNTASITYYGKPAFEAYGRGSSNPNLRTHNVMPHKGNNHPKNQQTYQSALIKGKKLTTSLYIPRKPIQEISHSQPNQTAEIIHIPMIQPDLLNHIRFADPTSLTQKDKTIPSNVVKPKPKKKNQSAKEQKKSQIKEKVKQQKMTPDGLKYLNIRQNLLSILEAKKSNSKKLAYKVTECYPFHWRNEEQLKDSRIKLDDEVIAGKATIKGQKVGDLLNEGYGKIELTD